MPTLNLQRFKKIKFNKGRPVNDAAFCFLIFFNCIVNIIKRTVIDYLVYLIDLLKKSGVQTTNFIITRYIL
jgi:hypothetical protein